MRPASTGQSTWAPLRVRAFRTLWLAQLGSLVGTFLLGCGIALTLPASQALVQELVPPAYVRSAAALGGVAVNGARAVGPALAGLIIAQVGPGVVFGLNAVGFVVLVAVLLRLRRPAPQVEAAPEHFLSAIRAGHRYVRHSPVVRRLLLRVALFVLPGAALWALLPLVADRLLRTGWRSSLCSWSRPESPGCGYSCR